VGDRCARLLGFGNLDCTARYTEAAHRKALSVANWWVAPGQLSEIFRSVSIGRLMAWVAKNFPAINVVSKLHLPNGWFKIIESTRQGFVSLIRIRE